MPKKRIRLKKTDTYYIDGKEFFLEISKSLTIYNQLVFDVLKPIRENYSTETEYNAQLNKYAKFQIQFQKQVDNKEFKTIKLAEKHHKQLLRNKALNKRSLELLMILAKRTIKKFYYENQLDMEDCRSMMYCDIIKYWTSFKPEKGGNAFAYYSSMIFTAAAKGWKELYPHKYKGTFSLSSNSFNDSNGVYSLPSYK